jgi:hypothetical protein
MLIKPLLEKVTGRRGGRLPGFILVVGDEASDDRMVEVVHQALAAAPPAAGIASCRTFTACVGKRACPSQFYVNGVEDVESLLSRLALSHTTTAAPASPFTAQNDSPASHATHSAHGSTNPGMYYD